MAAVQEKVSHPPMGGDSVRVSYDEYKPQKKSFYWVGVVPGAPMQNISTSECSFHGYVGQRGINTSTGGVTMTDRMGSVVEWSDEQLERVKKQLNYERIEVEKGNKVLEDQEGHRYKMSFETGRIRTEKDAGGVDNRHLQHTERLRGSKPLSAYVYIVPVTGVNDWPPLSEFIEPAEIVEGEGLVWGNVKQFKLGRVPAPVGQPGKVA